MAIVMALTPLGYFISHENDGYEELWKEEENGDK